MVLRTKKRTGTDPYDQNVVKAIADHRTGRDGFSGRSNATAAGEDVTDATFEFLVFRCKDTEFGRAKSVGRRISRNSLSPWRYSKTERIRDFTEANDGIVGFGWKHIERVSGLSAPGPAREWYRRFRRLGEQASARVVFIGHQTVARSRGGDSGHPQ